MEISMILFFISMSTFCIIYTMSWFSSRLLVGKPPPGPPGLPIIGNLLQLGNQPHRTMLKYSQKYGPLISLKIGSVTTVVASSPEIAKQLLRKNEKFLLSRPVPAAVSAQPNPEATIGWGVADQWWNSRRRVMNAHLFTSQKLDSIEELLHKKVGELISHIDRLCVSESAPVDIGRSVFATSLNLFSTIIFSVDLIDLDSGSAQEFKNLVGTIMEEAGKPNLSDFFPVLQSFDLQGMRKRIEPCYTRLHQIFDDIIDKRLQSRAIGSNAGDFLDVLIDQFDNDEPIFNRVNIKPLILDLFIAGSDTSAVTIEWAMTELLRNPEMLQKLHNEVNEKFDRIGAAKGISDMNQLPYLQAVIKETLRLHPAAPLLLPYKAKDNILIGDFTISKGSHVLVNQWSINRDPMYWENPGSFEPDRFLGSNNVDFKGHDFEFITFGTGRRICPGMPLAIRMLPLVVASLVRNFDWKLPEGTTSENIDMEEQFGITLKKAVPLLVIPTLKD